MRNNQLVDTIQRMSSRERSMAAAFVTAQANKTAMVLNFLIDYLDEKKLIDAKDFEQWAQKRIASVAEAQERLGESRIVTA